VDDKIIKAYATDETAKELAKRSKTEMYIMETPDGYIRYYGKIFIPTRQVDRIIRQFHEAKPQRHMGYQRLHNWLKERCYFPQMKQRIKKITTKCVDCKKAKQDRHAPYGKMQIRPAAERP
jgi:hypothetical protein